MKIGFQTILLGKRINNFESIAKAISASGYSGVEISQRIDDISFESNLYKYENNLDNIISCLKDNDLCLLGLCGDSIEVRVNYCLDSKLLSYPLYIYSEYCNEKDVEILRRYNQSIDRAKSLKLGIHSHVFKSVDRMGKLFRICEKYADVVSWIPDTAHIYISGENFIDILNSIDIKNINNIHIKDWTSAFGRSYHRYAKGFTQLGDGEIPLKSALDYLKELRYDGWLTFELDHTNEPVGNVMLGAVTYLYNSGIVGKFHKKVDFPVNGHDVKVLDSGVLSEGTKDIVTNIAYDLMISNPYKISDAYKIIVTVLKNAFSACHVGIWSCSENQKDVALVESFEDGVDILDIDPIFRLDDSIFEKVIQNEKYIAFTSRDLGKLAFIRGANRKNMVYSVGVLPILNRFNCHHMRSVITIVSSKNINISDQGFDIPLGQMEEMFKGSLPDILSKFIDFCLDSDCDFAKGVIDSIADKYQSTDKFLERIVSEIKILMKCEGVTLFLEDSGGGRLMDIATTGIRWRDGIPANLKFYTKDLEQSPTVECWQERSVLMLSNGLNFYRNKNRREPTSEEIVESKHHNILLVPIFAVSDKKNKNTSDIDEVIGVIRCRNKKIDDLSDIRYFNSDDAALLDAVCHSLSPYLENHLQKIAMMNMVAAMNHELKEPVTMIKNALSMFDRELKRSNIDYKSVMRFDYVSDVKSWAVLMSRVVANAQLYEKAHSDMKLKIEPTLLMADVVAPIERQLRSLVLEKGYDPMNVSYDDFDAVPKLYIDRNYFQQVIYNLLTNSVKYAFHDQKLFRIEVAGGADDKNYYIYCRDWGPGINAEDRDVIFQKAVRGSNEYLRQFVDGLGLGLWVVRKIVEMHGGYVYVSREYNPTEITIALPRYLEQKDWLVSQKNRKR